MKTRQFLDSPDHYAMILAAWTANAVRLGCAEVRPSEIEIDADGRTALAYVKWNGEPMRTVQGEAFRKIRLMIPVLESTAWH